MTSETRTTRRGMLLTAGAAGLGVLALTPGVATASPFPRLDKALEEMKEAKKFLENAKSGFGGHKKKAIEALTTAIDEIDAAIKFASK